MRINVKHNMRDNVKKFFGMRSQRPWIDAIAAAQTQVYEQIMTGGEPMNMIIEFDHPFSAYIIPFIIDDEGKEQELKGVERIDLLAGYYCRTGECDSARHYNSNLRFRLDRRIKEDKKRAEFSQVYQALIENEYFAGWVKREVEQTNVLELDTGALRDLREDIDDMAHMANHLRHVYQARIVKDAVTLTAMLDQLNKQAHVVLKSTERVTRCHALPATLGRPVRYTFGRI